MHDHSSHTLAGAPMNVPHQQQIQRFARTQQSHYHEQRHNSSSYGDRSNFAAHRRRSLDQPNLLFVGNLSYFCEISHLFDLFDQYGHVNGVRIVRNDNRSRTLMFGFVTMSTVHEANEMERILNGTFFMGRRLRVAISGRQHENSYDHLETSEGFPVHVGFISHFVEDQIIRPTEAWLRKVFTQYGVILDCSVKDYQWNKDTNRQEGYGFVSFASNDDATNAINVCRNMNVDGIILTCSRSKVVPNNRFPAVNRGGQHSTELVNSIPAAVPNSYQVPIVTYPNGSGIPILATELTPPHGYYIPPPPVPGGGYSYSPNPSTCGYDSMLRTITPPNHITQHAIQQYPMYMNWNSEEYTTNKQN